MNKAEKELRDFLTENPHLIPYQLKINKHMQNMSLKERLEFLTRQIVDNIEQLETELILLDKLSDFTLYSIKGDL